MILKLKKVLPQSTQRVVGWKGASTLLGSMASIYSSGALAQLQPAGTVTYGPLATPIPTLSGVGLVMLALMMASVIWYLKRGGWTEGGKFLGFSLMIGAAVSMTAGVKLISDANAVLDYLDLTNPSGGTENFYGGINCVRNITLVSQEIIKIEYAGANNGGIAGAVANGNGGANVGGCPTNGGDAPPCVDTPPKTVLEQNEICTITAFD